MNHCHTDVAEMSFSYQHEGGNFKSFCADLTGTRRSHALLFDFAACGARGCK
jgi:hypothetical protein